MGTVSLCTWDDQGRIPYVIFLLQDFLLTFAEARPLLLNRFLLNFHVVHGEVNQVVLTQLPTRSLTGIKMFCIMVTKKVTGGYHHIYFTIAHGY